MPDSSLESRAFQPPSPGTLLSQTLQAFDFNFDLDSPTDSTVVFVTNPSTMSTVPVAPAPVQATTKPKFGKVVGTYVWIGGAPLSDWSDTSSIPYCWRSNDPISHMKVYGRQTNGQDVKFKWDAPDYPLLSFATDALNHMEAHGMDTLFYMEGVGLSGVA